MGPGRSLSLLAKAYRDRTDLVPTRQESRLGFWSTKHDWQIRVQAADDAQRAAEDAARADIRAQRRIELENMDWEQGNALRDAAQSILSEVPKFIRSTVQRIERDGAVTEVVTVALKAGPGELAKAMEIASKIQRLSVGEATEIHKLVETELGAMLDLLQSQLTPEEYARVVAVIAGGASA